MLAIHNSPGSHRGQSALSGSQDFRIMNYNHLPARDRNYEIQRYTPNLQMMPPPSAEQIKPGKLDTPLKIIKTVVITIIKSWHCTGPLFIANKNSSTFFRVNRVKSPNIFFGVILLLLTAPSSRQRQCKGPGITRLLMSSTLKYEKL